MVVVAVDDIGDSDIQDFATELFGKWGIGKRDKDNGLLVLIVKGQRQAVIRTGYGVEGVVPDVVAGRIIRNDMAPYYREGDYDNGTIAAVAHLNKLLTDPEVRDEIASAYANDASARDGSEGNLFMVYMCVAIGLTVIMMLFICSRWLSTRREDRYERYRKLEELKMASMIVACLSIGIGLIDYLILWMMLKHLRRGKRVCPNCATRMQLVDEERDNDYLTPAQDTEEKIDSVDYDVWLCPNCSQTEIFPYVNKSAPYQECPKCHARAARLVDERVIQNPTTRAEGILAKTYVCRNCGNSFKKTFNIPKVVEPPVIIGGGGFGGGGGGGFSGGSFGGGMTGGGGARGGW